MSNEEILKLIDILKAIVFFGDKETDLYKVANKKLIELINTFKT